MLIRRCWSSWSWWLSEDQRWLQGLHKPLCTFLHFNANVNLSVYLSKRQQSLILLSVLLSSSRVSAMAAVRVQTSRGQCGLHLRGPGGSWASPHLVEERQGPHAWAQRQADQQQQVGRTNLLHLISLFEDKNLFTIYFKLKVFDSGTKLYFFDR